MSQSIRKILVAMSVATALLVSVPAPSWAAQARKPASEHTLGLMEQVWSWFGSLLGNSRQPGAQRKDMITPPVPLPPPPGQGPAIDPDGSK